MRKSVSKYSLEERLKISKEYETSSLTALELVKKYGLHSPNSIAVWRNRFANSKKSINFAPENDTSVVEETCMVDKSIVIKLGKCQYFAETIYFLRKVLTV